MADTTKTIKKTGGDYASIMLWEADTDVSAGRWIGEISDNEEYLNEAIVISGGTGTPDADNFVWLKAAAANKHAGISGSGHARVRRTTSGHVFTVTSDYVVISDLEVKQDSTGVSAECFRIPGHNCLFSRLIVHTGELAINQDCFYHGYTVQVDDIYIDNCVIYDTERSGIFLQIATTFETTVYVDSCTFFNNGQETYSGNICLVDSGQNNAVVYNSIAILSDTPGSGAECFELSTYSGNPGYATWAGSNNIASDGGCESKFTSSYDSVTLIDTDPVSGENVHVTSISGDDMTLVEEDSETVTQNGVDRSAVHPAPQTIDGSIKLQDLSTDIIGTARGTSWSIGAFQLPSSAVFPYHIIKQRRRDMKTLLTM